MDVFTEFRPRRGKTIENQDARITALEPYTPRRAARGVLTWDLYTVRVRAQRSAQGDLTRLDYVRCDKVRKVSYSELGLLVISVACQVVLDVTTLANVPPT